MKWEYKIVGNGKPERLTDDEYYEALRTNYRRWGKEGWELVTVSKGIAYFKRPLKNSGAEMSQAIDMGIE